MTGRQGRRGRDDAGITMVEVVVAMTIMSVFMSVFTAGIILMFRSANRTEAHSAAQSGLNIAFLRLDRQLRYAAQISVPGTVGADSYVEFLTTGTGVAQCQQLRLVADLQQLQVRSWIRGSTPPRPSAWLPLVSGVSSPSPFRRISADPTYNFQRLTVTLTSVAGAGASRAARSFTLTFTALNAPLSTALTGDSDTVCTEGRSI